MSQKSSKLQSYKEPLKLIIACLIGAVIGLWLGPRQDAPGAAATLSILASVGQIFLNLLFCILVPLIFFSIAGSIANNKDIRKVGKMLVYTIVFFIATAALAGVITLIVVHFTGVPHNFVGDSSAQAAAETSLTQQIVGTFTVGDLPDLISRYHVLPLIIMTIFFGICTGLVGKEGEMMASFLQSGSAVMYKMTELLMKLAPLGIGCYFADLTAVYGVDLLKTYGQAMIVFYVIVFAYFFIGLGFYAWLAAGSWGVKNFFRVILSPALTALGTRSSAAAIPLQMNACDELGVPREISSVVIPLGATMHMDGACIAMTYATILATTMFGVPVHGLQYLLVLFVAVASSVATSSVPGGGAAGETMIVSVFSLPAAAMPILLMVIELFDPGCTLLNSCGDTVASMLVTRILYGRDWYQKKLR